VSFIISQGSALYRGNRVEIGSGLAVTQVSVGGRYVTKIDTAAAYGITQEQADIRYVLKSGDTMTGTFNARDILPTADNTYSLGSGAFRWTGVHAVTLYGYGAAAVVVPPTGRIHFDGSAAGNSYIYESSDDNVQIVAGSVTALHASSSWLGTSRDFYVLSTKKVYLDGGFNTYLTEPSGDRIHLVAGGTVVGDFASPAIDSIGLTLAGGLSIPATSRFYFDFGTNVFITSAATNNLHFYAGNASTAQGWFGPGYFTVLAGNRIGFDSNGDTYLVESAANTLDAYSGAARVTTTYSSGFAVWNGKQLWLDGGGNTYMWEYAADEVSHLVGGTTYLRIRHGAWPKGSVETFGAYGFAAMGFNVSTDGSQDNYRWSFIPSGDNLLVYSRSYGTAMHLLYTTGQVGVNMNPTSAGFASKLCVSGGIWMESEWFRISGAVGIYWQTYGGGWRMTDATYIEAYGSKKVKAVDFELM
jgi:hypothetical protein